MTDQPSEVKEGGALAEAVEALKSTLAAADHIESVGVMVKSDALRTVLGALAARPPSMERGEAEEAAQRLFHEAQRVYREDHDHFPLKNAWEALSEEIRAGWRRMASAAWPAPSPAPSAVEMAGVEEMVERLWVKPCGDHGSYSRGHDNGWNSALRAILALATASRGGGSAS